MRLATAAFALMLAAPASAQDWHDAYRAGLTALARGNHARAAEALQRAITLRPEPGRNVVTYRTNLEPRYFPYLRLAEARLALGQLDAAREALERSASWGTRQPAEERQALLVRIEAALATRRAASASAAAPPPPATLATPTPAPSPTAAVEPAALAPVQAAPEAPSTVAPAIVAAPSARPRAAPAPPEAPRWSSCPARRSTHSCAARAPQSRASRPGWSSRSRRRSTWRTARASSTAT